MGKSNSTQNYRISPRKHNLALIICVTGLPTPQIILALLPNQNMRELRLSAVLLRICVLWNVMLCRWVSSSFHMPNILVFIFECFTSVHEGTTFLWYVRTTHLWTCSSQCWMDTDCREHQRVPTTTARTWDAPLVSIMCQAARNQSVRLRAGGRQQRWQIQNTGTGGTQVPASCSVSSPGSSLDSHSQERRYRCLVFLLWRASNSRALPGEQRGQECGRCQTSQNRVCFSGIFHRVNHSGSKQIKI